MTSGLAQTDERSRLAWPHSTPPHWQVDRLKWSIAGLFNGIWGDEPDGIDDIICVRVADFDRVRLSVVDSPPTLRAVTPKERSGRVLSPGDLLIEKSGGGDNQPVGCVVSFDHTFDAVCSNFVGRMRMAPGMWPRYWAYVHASLYSGRLNVPAIKQTTGIQNLDSDAYFNQHVPFPPTAEQRAIADYLNREMERLRALVEAKERLVTLLTEKRRALITRVVTRGLDPAAPVHDSGIPWLGEIPTHWTLKRGKWLFRERDERSTTGEETLLSLRMERGLVPHNEVSEKQTRPEELVGYKKVAPTEIVLNRMRAASGLVAVSQQNGLVSPDYAIFQSEPEVEPEYFTHLFKTELLQSIFRSESTGLGTGSSGFLRLYSENFLALWLPCPPLQEQRRILNYISEQTAKIARMADATNRTILLIKERRSALITAAVTGQIEVGNTA